MDGSNGKEVVSPVGCRVIFTILADLIFRSGRQGRGKVFVCVRVWG